MTLARELPPHQQGAREGSRGHTQGQREPWDQREVSRSFLEAAMSPWSLKDTPELRGRGRRRWHSGAGGRGGARLAQNEVLKFWSNE